MIKNLCIIAGGGDYPLKIINQCIMTKQPFCVMALEGQCDSLIQDDINHIWLSFGAVGKGLKYLKDNNVTDIILAGNIQRPSLSEIKPDFIGMIWMAKIASKSQGDDAILSALSEQFENEGYKVIGSKDIFNEAFFMPEGIVTKTKPNDLDIKDIEIGVDILKGISKYDIGQSIVIQQGVCLGVEAIEGTAKLIKRAGCNKLSGDGGALVKIAKINQDKRIDLPTVGLDTIDQIVSADLKGLALEIGNVQILDKEKFFKKADDLKIFVIGINVNGKKN